jgi:hypothetical protein
MQSVGDQLGMISWGSVEDDDPLFMLSVLYACYLIFTS